MRKFRELTDNEWERIAPLLPELKPDKRPSAGRAPVFDLRAVLNGVLWVLYSGSVWHALPPEYPPENVCRTRFNRWWQDGAMHQVADALADSRGELGGLIRSRIRVRRTSSSLRR